VAGLVKDLFLLKGSGRPRKSLFVNESGLPEELCVPKDLVSNKIRFDEEIIVAEGAWFGYKCYYC
jgi:hypothetical protein